MHTLDRELELAPGWLLIDPPGRVPGPIAHLVVGTGGVLAVARWSGEVGVEDGVLHQDGRCRRLQGEDLVRAAADVAALLHPDHRVVAPVVLTDGDAPPAKVAPGLILMGVDTLAWTLAGLPTHLGADDVADVVGRVAQARARRTDQLPTQATLAAVLTADRGRRRPRL